MTSSRKNDLIKLTNHQLFKISIDEILGETPDEVETFGKKTDFY